MATEIRILVNKEIRRLGKDIALERSELATLREELAKLKKIDRLLGRDTVPRRRVAARRARKRK